MEKTTRNKFIALVLIFACFFSGSSLSAAPRLKNARLRLYLEKTPQFKDSKYGSGGSGGYWLALRTDLELTGGRDEWIDEMEMNYKILLPRKNGKLVLLEQTHKVVDVQCGEKLRTVVYVRPTMIKRITGVNRADINKISAYVDCRQNGLLLHREPITHNGNGMPKGWFKSKDLGKMKKYVSDIFPRFRTPFAVMDYDYYIPEKQD